MRDVTTRWLIALAVLPGLLWLGGCGEDPPPAPAKTDSFARLQQSVDKLAKPDPPPVADPTPAPEPLAAENEEQAPSVAASADGGQDQGASERPSAHRIEVTSVNVQPPTFYSGVDITVKPEIKCPEGVDVQCQYQWFINDQLVDGIDGPVLPGDRFKRDDRISMTIVPVDAEGEGPVFVSSTVVVPNGPPLIVSQPPMTLEGGTFEYQVKVEEPDGDPVTFSLEGAPPGMVINEKTGLITWTFDGGNTGDYRVKVTARDPGGLKSIQEYNMNLSMQQRP